MRKWLGGIAAMATVATTGAVVLATVSAGPAMAAGTGTGYLHTSGSKIVDSTGATVRLTGLNWFGMETDNHTFHGLWAGRTATWRMQIDHMAQLGYNTIRVPYTGDSLRSGAQATSINSDSNPDLLGLSPLQILDQIVNYAGSKGMRIILDRHRPSAAGQTALWYTAAVSEASEIADWQMLASRYAGNTTVIGADLFNEPHADGQASGPTGACWGCGDTARDWRLAAQRIGNAVLAAQPNWLVIVEGISCPTGGPGADANHDNQADDPLECDWWGGNLAGAAQFPVQLSVANRLVYSAHDYGISVFDRQPWFKDPTFPANLPSVWNHFWGYLVQQNIAPVLIGEFGSTLQNPLDTQWLQALMNYMGSGVNGMSFTYWSWNPDSGDTGGIVQDDWLTVNQNKQSIVGPFLIPPVGGGSQPASSQPASSRPASSQPASSSRPASSQPASSSRPPSSSAAQNGSCTAAFTTVNDWGSGFQAKVNVTAGTTALTGWNVTFTLPAGWSIVSLWDGTATAGTPTRVTNASYNGSVPAGGTSSFSFTANGSATAAPAFTCTGS
jgi:endoglucanase